VLKTTCPASHIVRIKTIHGMISWDAPGCQLGTVITMPQILGLFEMFGGDTANWHCVACDCAGLEMFLADIILLALLLVLHSPLSSMRIFQRNLRSIFRRLMEGDWSVMKNQVRIFLKLWVPIHFQDHEVHESTGNAAMIRQLGMSQGETGTATAFIMENRNSRLGNISKLAHFVEYMCTSVGTIKPRMHNTNSSTLRIYAYCRAVPSCSTYDSEVYERRSSRG
jgi:hypothetical protein